MEKNLLNTKWLGTICVVVVSFIFAYLACGYAANAIKTLMPTFVEEASQFLPITVENGAIVEPKDTLISKSYGVGDKTFNVVLDTRVDEISVEDLGNQGIYFSRKFIYGVKSDRTEVRSLSDMSNMTIDQDMLLQGAEWMENKSGGYIFASLFFGLLIYFSLAILLYTIVLHLVVGIAMKVGFGRTLRVTTLGYLALFIIGAFTVSIGVIVTFILLLGINCLVAKYFPQKTAETA